MSTTQKKKNGATYIYIVGWRNKVDKHTDLKLKTKMEENLSHQSQESIKSKTRLFESWEERSEEVRSSRFEFEQSQSHMYVLVAIYQNTKDGCRRTTTRKKKDEK